MYSVLSKTFGGLSASYYIRQFLFGLIFTVSFIFISESVPNGTGPICDIIVIANTFLYPYARFVYQSIFEYIMGGNVFFVSALPMLGLKIFTMLLCWSLAIFIAPVAFVWLYFMHSRSST